MEYNFNIKYQKSKIKKNSGFTLIEAVMVISIIAILSVTGVFLMTYLIQNSVFIPNQLNCDMLASDAMDIMIEGDSQAKGLRFSRIFSTILPQDMTFINQDGQTIRYRLNANLLYRSINGVESQIPYYLPPGATFNTAQFSYFDSTQTATADPNNVRLVTVQLTAQTGGGAATLHSAVEDVGTVEASPPY